MAVVLERYGAYLFKTGIVILQAYYSEKEVRKRLSTLQEFISDIKTWVYTDYSYKRLIGSNRYETLIIFSDGMYRIKELKEVYTEEGLYLELTIKNEIEPFEYISISTQDKIYESATTNGADI